MRDPVKLSFFICPSLCDQKMEMRMKVNPASERLDHCNDAQVEIFFLVASRYFIRASLPQTQSSERSERLNLKNIRSILGMVKTTCR